MEISDRNHPMWQNFNYDLHVAAAKHRRDAFRHWRETLTLDEARKLDEAMLAYLKCAAESDPE